MPVTTFLLLKISVQTQRYTHIPIVSTHPVKANLISKFNPKDTPSVVSMLHKSYVARTGNQVVLANWLQNEYRDIAGIRKRHESIQ